MDRAAGALSTVRTGIERASSLPGQGFERCPVSRHHGSARTVRAVTDWPAIAGDVARALLGDPTGLPVGRGEGEERRTAHLRHATGGAAR